MFIGGKIMSEELTEEKIAALQAAQGHPGPLAPATLYLAGLPPAIGQTICSEELQTGTFYPSERLLLDTSYPEAMLKVSGKTDPVRIYGLRLCSLTHFHFGLTPQAKVAGCTPER